MLPFPRTTEPSNDFIDVPCIYHSVDMEGQYQLENSDRAGPLFCLKDSSYHRGGTSLVQTDDRLLLILKTRQPISAFGTFS
jgi:hypothetical protein